MIIFHLEGAKVTQSAPFTVRTEVSTKFFQLIFSIKFVTHRHTGEVQKPSGQRTGIVSFRLIFLQEIFFPGDVPC